MEGGLARGWGGERTAVVRRLPARRLDRDDPTERLAAARHAARARRRRDRRGPRRRVAQRRARRAARRPPGPGTQALAFHALRWLGAAEAVRRRLAAEGAAAEDRRPAARRARPALAGRASRRTPSTCWSTRPWRRRGGATRARRRFVNAVLRRFLREREALVEAVAADPVGALEPSGVVARAAARPTGRTAWQAIADADNTRPPMTLRVNARRAHGRGLPRRARRRRAGRRGGRRRSRVRAAPPGAGRPPAGLRRGRGLGPGRATPSAPSPLLLAAPLAPGRARPRRLRRPRRQDRAPARAGRPRRAGDRPRPGAAGPGRRHAGPPRPDGPHPAPPTPRRPERLVGRPAVRRRSCSTRPAAPRASSAAIPTCAGCAGRATSPALAATQARLLDALWPLLAPGGRLLYCTCSVFRAEGQDADRRFFATTRRCRPRCRAAFARAPAAAARQ